MLKGYFLLNACHAEAKAYVLPTGTTTQVCPIVIVEAMRKFEKL